MSDQPEFTGTTIACPICQRELRLSVVPERPERVQAFCNHGNMAQPPRAVYETDRAPEMTKAPPKKAVAPLSAGKE
jgi:hypothetical protein